MDSLNRISLFPLVFILLMLFSFSVSSTQTQFNIPRLRARGRTIKIQPKTKPATASQSNDFKTFFFTQSLDHFNYRPESYTTFQQRYVINFKHWGGPNTSAPIFVCFGEEQSIDNDVEINGFLPDNAPRFKALLVYIEVLIIHVLLYIYVHAILIINSYFSC